MYNADGVRLNKNIISDVTTILEVYIVTTYAKPTGHGSVVVWFRQCSLFVDRHSTQTGRTAD